MIRNLLIKPVLNGFIVEVGCQTVVFKSAAELASAVNEYYADPEVTERRYRDTAVNKQLISDGLAAIRDASNSPLLQATAQPAATFIGSIGATAGHGERRSG